MRKKIAFGDAGAGRARSVVERLGLPVGCAGAVFHHVASETSPMPHGHRHAEWEFNLVTRGRAVYLIEGRRVPLELDSLLWLLPAQGHILLDRSPDFRMWIVVVRPREIRQLSRDSAFAPWKHWLRQGSPPPPLQHRLIGEQAARQLTGLCQRLVTPPLQSDAWPALSPAHHAAGLAFLAAEAWAAFLAAPDRPVGSHLHPAVQRAVNWLADHAHRPQANDLDALADRCHVSRPHLSRLFKMQTGQTLTDFRHRQRVDRFTRLVGRGGRLTLTQAAYAAGFGSYAQAYRVIRHVTGQNPRSWLNAASA